MYWIIYRILRAVQTIWATVYSPGTLDFTQVTSVLYNKTCHLPACFSGSQVGRYCCIFHSLSYYFVVLQELFLGYLTWKRRSIQGYCVFSAEHNVLHMPACQFFDTNR